MATDCELKGYRFYPYKSLNGNCYKYDAVDPKYYDGETWQKFQDQYGKFGIYDTELAAFEKCCELNEQEKIINSTAIVTKIEFGLKLTSEEATRVKNALNLYDSLRANFDGGKNG